jgi:DNA topoisomerase VI B subunit|tara:strand:- start:8414 stop:11383 length:2970 start_codon:yes stop_codon:yes gene_type:complete
MAEKIKAVELAKLQKEISISEFFTKNRHLLGFDNPRKALLTTVKEAVDNSLDACEEMGVLPDIIVKIEQTTDNRFKIVVEDNGPGIIKQQIPNIFAKLLYGSKFHSLKQSLTYDEPIMIQKNKKIEILPIGELVDSYIKSEEGIKEVNNILVPSFDWRDYRYNFRKVSHLIKHKRENEIIKIKIATNREIKVTGCHSLFTEENGIVKEVEARKLQKGSKIIVPSKIPKISDLKEINILNYINLDDIDSNWLYVYNLPDQLLQNLKGNAEIIHKKTSKSRRFYRINNIDILDDSFKQYELKNFLPLHLVYKLQLQDKVKDSIIKSYYHGEETVIPITFPLTKEFIKFLGFYVAEGHYDKRQIGLTFSRYEDHLIKEVLFFARQFGLNFTIENREKTIRVKIFGNIFTKLIKNICGKLAKNKKIPEFIFRLNEGLRQDFLDALYQGDGHNTKNRNQLMLSTISKRLANEVLYLWLMQGVLASFYQRMNHGLGRKPTISYVVSLYGKDIEKSKIFTCNKSLGYNKISQQLLQKELLLIRVKDVEIINEGYDYVYDISIPECENFIGGFGGIACHNSRGQQGIGISASVMYAQLTTGKPTKIVSKISPKKPAHQYELHMDTKKNEPEIISDKEIEWKKDHGTKIELELEGSYQKGRQGVFEYIKETAIINPHLNLIYYTPEKKKMTFPRIANELPVEPKEIKPHPYGVELGMLIDMMKSSKSRNISSFLSNDFSRVSSKVAKDVLAKAEISEKIHPSKVSREEADRLLKIIRETKIMAPPTNCLSPIEEDLLLEGLKKEIKADFYASVTRQPSVYRGNPFLIEVAMAYGGDLEKEDSVRVLRFANRVPLLYQQSACASIRSIIQTSWNNYGLSQSKKALPSGPVIILVHIASVWVPFTSESKEAIAHYPEIIKEMKLALQDCGRKLGSYIRKTVKAKEQKEKIDLFEKYIPEIASSLSTLSGEKKENLIKNLSKMLKKNLPNLNNNQNGKEEK